MINNVNINSTHTHKEFSDYHLILVPSFWFSLTTVVVLLLAFGHLHPLDNVVSSTATTML